MAVVSLTGITPTTLEEYVVLLEEGFKAVFGDDLDVSTETPQGQLIGIIAMSLAQADEGVVSSFSSTSIFDAFGQQLEGLFSALAVSRNPAINTIVEATLTGVVTSLIPAGSRARTVNGDLFALDADAVIGGGGSVTAAMSAIEPGPIEVLAAELDSIVDVVTGWETVTNVSDGTTGREVETDSNYRRRYQRELSKNAIAPLDSIVARVSDLTSVLDVVGAENDKSTTEVIQGLSLDPHSVAIVVDGGIDADIAAAIRIAKTGGTGTNGTTTVPVTYEGGIIDIRFFKATAINFELGVNISVTPGTATNVTDLIKTRVQEYVEGVFDTGDDSLFETDGLQIGETLYKFRLLTPINSVPGVIVNAITLDTLGGGGDVSEIAIDLNQRIKLASLNDIDVTIV